MLKKLILLFIVFVVANIQISSTIWYYFFYRTVGSYFDNDGVKIHYTVEGEGEPVVLVHGFAVNGDMNFRRMGVNGCLNEKYKVITLGLADMASVTSPTIRKPMVKICQRMLLRCSIIWISNKLTWLDIHWEDSFL